MRRHIGFRKASAKALLATALLIAMTAPASFAQEGRTFYIDESTDFTGNGCENSDLNTVTSSLCSALVACGWFGTRYVNSMAWPQDFYEGGFGGLDHQYADTKMLAVYAGHGNVNFLQFGFPHNGQCGVNIEGQMRLGTGWGDTAGYMMYLTSCTMRRDRLHHLQFNQVHQQFGYHNSPSIKDDQPRDFFNATGPSGQCNKGAWLDEMEDKPSWFTGDNSPIVLTYGINQEDCLYKHANAKLRSGSFLWKPAEPWGWWAYTVRNG
jgi:hypothetical protein